MLTLGNYSAISFSFLRHPHAQGEESFISTFYFYVIYITNGNDGLYFRYLVNFRHMLHIPSTVVSLKTT